MCIHVRQHTLICSGSLAKKFKIFKFFRLKSRKNFEGKESYLPNFRTAVGFSKMLAELLSQS